jgi:hypothetical protein
MAIAYNIVDFRGVAAEPVVEEILFECSTIAQDLVTFEEDVKAETIFTEATASAVLQAYTSGVPTSAGSLTLFDVAVTPVKTQFYQEFDPNTVRFSRFKRTLKPGAWEILSEDFERIMIGGIYAKKAALALESWFWNGISTTTQTTIAGLTAGTANTSVGAAEKTMIAALTIPAGSPVSDGIITKMIYNSSNATATAGVGTRIKVAGTSITAANIKAEYDKIFAAIPTAVFDGDELPMIYAPKSHKQFLVQANNVTTDFKKPFDIDVTATNFTFNGLKIVFVPVPEKVVICALKSHLVWATDLLSDTNLLKIDNIALNREDMFVKINSTLASHVVNQQFNVLYVG